MRCVPPAGRSPRTRPWPGRDRRVPPVIAGVPVDWYGVVFAVAILVSFLATFPVRRLATPVGDVAQPDDRKTHQGVPPQAGGVAMFVALLVAFSVAALIPQL